MIAVPPAEAVRVAKVLGVRLFSTASANGKTYVFGAGWGSKPIYIPHPLLLFRALGPLSTDEEVVNATHSNVLGHDIRPSELFPPRVVVADTSMSHVVEFVYFHWGSVIYYGSASDSELIAEEKKRLLEPYIEVLFYSSNEDGTWTLVRTMNDIGVKKYGHGVRVRCDGNTCENYSGAVKVEVSMSPRTCVKMTSRYRSYEAPVVVGAALAKATGRNIFAYVKEPRPEVKGDVEETCSVEVCGSPDEIISYIIQVCPGPL